ncbi:hypothetical protein [Acinetobacter baumannii]|uniref:hypothetical protein n=1 Tax=Acinetobacter baumannii TaxID=470 RepID=UPI003D2FC083
MTRARVHQTGGDFADEDPIETGLIAADTGVDLIGASDCALDQKFGVGKERAGHRHHIGIAARQDISATCGSLMRLVVISGTDTAPFSCRVTQLPARRAVLAWRWSECAPHASQCRY